MSHPVSKQPQVCSRMKCSAVITGPLTEPESLIKGLQALSPWHFDGHMQPRSLCTVFSVAVHRESWQERKKKQGSLMHPVEVRLYNFVYSGTAEVRIPISLELSLDGPVCWLQAATVTSAPFPTFHKFMMSLEKGKLLIDNFLTLEGLPRVVLPQATISSATTPALLHHFCLLRCYITPQISLYFDCISFLDACTGHHWQLNG